MFSDDRLLRILPLPVTSFVIWGKFLNPSKSSFLVNKVVLISGGSTVLIFPRLGQKAFSAKCKLGWLIAIHEIYITELLQGLNEKVCLCPLKQH